MPHQLISEAIKPVAHAMDTGPMGQGEPGIPVRFTWRGQQHTIARIIRRWKETGPAREGGTAMYVRKHWILIVTTEGIQMKIYFDRQPRGRGGAAKQRWWLYSIDRSGSADSA